MMPISVGMAMAGRYQRGPEPESPRRSGKVMTVRQQLTAFLDPPLADRLDEIRQQHDPVMAARIRPHFTVLYEVPDLDAVIEQLAGARTLRMRLAGVRRWPPPDDGLFLGLTDPHGDLTRLRAALGIDHPGHYEPHVTLMHPATTGATDRNAAWAMLRGLHFDLPIEVTGLSVIGWDDSGWHELQRLELPAR
jgi:2'-5' RNA ligase